MYSLLLKRCIRSSAKTWRGIRLMMKTYPPHADTCNTKHVTHKKKIQLNTEIFYLMILYHDS